MGQCLIINVPLLPELFHNVIYPERVLVKNGVRHKTEAARFVHDLLIVTGGELTLVGKKDPARQLVPVEVARCEWSACAHRSLFAVG